MTFSVSLCLPPSVYLSLSPSRIRTFQYGGESINLREAVSCWLPVVVSLTVLTSQASRSRGFGVRSGYGGCTYYTVGRDKSKRLVLAVHVRFSMLWRLMARYVP
ncbi:hypothetical protein BaRGS_00017724 [Batillaria attramentaria]|uniref:Secreted protein n=1 Tax=Batillaria attramentaria TaxID=370345 RepID=A0ABD0KVV0_9CAEN